MTRTHMTVLRMTALLLLSGAFAAQCVGISQVHKLANGTSSTAIVQADGPLPPPGPTPIP